MEKVLKSSLSKGANKFHEEYSEEYIKQNLCIINSKGQIKFSPIKENYVCSLDSSKGECDSKVCNVCNLCGRT